MKKVFFTTIISLVIFSGYSQVNPSASKIDHQYEMDQFLIKAKKQKTAAWVCLGGGIALFTTGALIMAPKIADEYWWTPKEKQSNVTGESIIMVVGMAGVITSIPLFIASGNNRHKARLLIASQNAAFISPLAVSKKVTGLTLSIAL